MVNVSAHYQVIWSGTNRRDYLAAEHHDAVPAQERRKRSRGGQDTGTAWLAGNDWPSGAEPRKRLFYSVQSANGKFSVPELAMAARVSRTLARRYVAKAILLGRCRPAGIRPTGWTRTLLFERVP